jgi:hypothetical protein
MVRLGSFIMNTEVVLLDFFPHSLDYVSKLSGERKRGKRLSGARDEKVT